VLKENVIGEVQKEDSVSLNSSEQGKRIESRAKKKFKSYVSKIKMLKQGTSMRQKIFKRQKSTIL